MFWRNNYTNNENNMDYFYKKKRTNYTYADSGSYRIVPEKQNINEPYLMRDSIRKTILDTESFEYNTESNDDGMLRKSLGNKVTISQSSTPNRRKNHSGDSDRVLRSRTYVTSQVNSTSTIQFVREHDERDIYKFGILNTNTNNSGPDEILHDKSKRSDVDNYDLSGDEGMGSDTVDSDNQLGNFGSNNANSIRPTMQHRDKTKTQWFQRNMFGLPNDESDEVNEDLSGAVSGDEQYNIGAYQQSNLNQKSRLSKWQTKKSHRSDLWNSNRKFDNIFCSPLAMISLLIEWIVSMVTTVIRHSVRYVKQAAYHSNIVRWLTVPFYLPIVFIKQSLTAFAYSSDRLFGTTMRRRLNLNNRSKYSLFDIISSILWLLFLAAFVIVLLHFFLGDNTNQTPETKFSFDFDLDLSKHFYRFVGNDCMENNNCCKNNWEQIRRFTYCLFSLPARLIIPNDDHFNTTESLQQTSNVSSLEGILETFKNIITKQDQKMANYDEKLYRLESHMQTVSSSRQSTSMEISEVQKDMESQILNLKAELGNLKLAQSKTGDVIENLTENQLNNLNLKYTELDASKQKLENHMQTLTDLVGTLKEQSLSNSESIKNLELLLNEFKKDLQNVKSTVIALDNRTETNAHSNQIMNIQLGNLKKEIMYEVSEEIKQLSKSQQKVNTKFNEQMSIFEMKINEHQSKLSDKEFVDKLVKSHFENLKQDIKDEINTILWQNLTDHVNNLMKSTNMKIEQNKASNLYLSNNENSCNRGSLNSFSRSSLACVRIHQVRQLIKDALNLFAADKIGVPDFALESAGGTIATTRCTETYTDRASTITIFGIPLVRLTNSPRTIIQPTFYPGECWPMRGSRGAVVVQLSAQVKVTSVSIDHIPKSISPSESIDSAIQDFEIKALANETDKIGISLGNFTYLIDSNPVQTFYIQNQMETKFIELIVNSNYGNKDYTCIYRLRVHGKLIKF